LNLVGIPGVSVSTSTIEITEITEEMHRIVFGVRGALGGATGKMSTTWALG